MHSPDAILTLAEVEARHIRAVFEACNHNVTATARALDIDRRTTYRKLHELQLKTPGRGSPWNNAAALRERLAQLEAK